MIRPLLLLLLTLMGVNALMAEDLCKQPSPDDMAKAAGVKLPGLPWHVANIWWEFDKPVEHFTSLEIDVMIDRDVPSDYNLYVSPCGIAKINDMQFYGGLQTNINGWPDKESRERVFRGKGAIFSRWSNDKKTPIGLDHVRPASDDCLVESAGYEGEFASIRRPFTWTKGTYTYCITKDKSETVKGVECTWFKCSVKDSSGQSQDVGDLRFEGTDFTFWAKHSAFVEVYSTAKISKPGIPKVNVTFGWPRLNGQKIALKKAHAYYPDQGGPDSPDCAWIRADGESCVVEVGPIFKRDEAKRRHPLTLDPVRAVIFEDGTHEQDRQNAPVALRTALASLRPESVQGATVRNNPGRPYVLYGDLFKTGTVYALVDLNRIQDSQGDGTAEGVGMALAEWTGAAWEARNFVLGGPVWRPKGWQRSDQDYLLGSPANSPFTLLDVSGKGCMALVVPSSLERWGQVYNIYFLDPRTHHLVRSRQNSVEEPTLENEPRLLVLCHRSGRRAIFLEWIFTRCSEVDNDLAVVASIHDETPYNGDDSFVEISRARRDKKEFLRMTGNKLTYSQADLEFHAQWQVHWNTAGPHDTDVEAAMVMACFFERFTDLPRKLIRELTEFKGVKDGLEKLENLAGIDVMGDSQIVEMLTSQSKPNTH